MEDQIAPEQRASDGPGTLDRAAALKRSGLIFLGGFAASAVAETPVAEAQAIKPPTDNPPWGIGFFSRGKPLVHASAPMPKFPRKAAYQQAQYFGIVLKNDTEHGIPNLDDLSKLEIPLPAIPGIALLAAYVIPATTEPHASSWDVHGIETHNVPGGIPFPGPKYSAYLLVYGQP